MLDKLVACCSFNDETERPTKMLYYYTSYEKNYEPRDSHSRKFGARNVCAHLIEHYLYKRATLLLMYCTQISYMIIRSNYEPDRSATDQIGRSLRWGRQYNRQSRLITDRSSTASPTQPYHRACFESIEVVGSPGVYTEKKKKTDPLLSS